MRANKGNPIVPSKRATPTRTATSLLLQVNSSSDEDYSKELTDHVADFVSSQMTLRSDLKRQKLAKNAEAEG